MEPTLLIPPSETDPGVIERVVSDRGKARREAWDVPSASWRPSGEITPAVLHGRPLSIGELRAAGIPSSR